MMKRCLVLILQLCCFLAPQAAGVAGSGGPSWIRDFNAGQAAANREQKDLLVVFTGHGWCASCEILDREVFQNAVFVRAIGDAFVFVELDFNFGSSTQEEQRESAYHDLQKRYLAPAVPTIYLLDPAGVPYAVFEGYKTGTGPQKVLEQIQQARVQRAVRDLKFAVARKTAGPGRAALLHAGLQAVAPLLGTLEERGDDPILTFYPTAVAEIRQLDAGPAAALRNIYDSRQKKRDEKIALDRSIFDKIKKYQQARDNKGALAFIEKSLKDFKTPDVRGRLEGAREYFFEQDDQYEAGLKNVRRLLNDPNLTPEERERWIGREAFHLSHLGRVQEALAIFDRQIRESQSAPEIHRRWLSRRAQMIYMRKDVAPPARVSALREYRDAVKPDTDDWQVATSMLAHQLQRDGDQRAALKFKRELLQAEPKNPWFLVDVAESQIALDEMAAARALIDDAEKALPTNLKRESEMEQDHRIRAWIARLRDRIKHRSAQ
jgi:thioredoxin-related protein